MTEPSKVALDKVTHAHTTCHQRNTIEEVFQKILHRKTHTRGQSCRNDSDARFRHLQQKECVEDVGAPNEDGNDVVGKGKVVLIGREFTPHPRDVLIERTKGVVEIREYEPESNDKTDFMEGEL